MKHNRSLLWALMLSAGLHAVWLVDMEVRWPFWHAEDDETLSRQKAEKVKRVRLALSGRQAIPGIPTVTLLRPAGSETGVAEAPVPDPKAAAAKPADKGRITTENPVAAVSDSTTAAAAAAVVAAEPEEPAPSFPVSIVAIHLANYYGFRMELRQQWLMEGYNYSIINQASKFGFSSTISSEGTVSPDGLQPLHYRLLLNNALRHYADFDRSAGLLIHGKAGARKTMPLTADFQDMASLPYHVAVSYEGEQEKQLKVTTGSSVYDIVLRLQSEEVLRLPGGKIRTLHLTGDRTRSDGTRQSGYDIWLAPDYRNFPVKFRGPDSKGNLLEMSVVSLSFDGRRVFGKDGVDEPLPPEPQSPPADMLRQHGVEPLPAPGGEAPAVEAEPAPSPPPATPAETPPAADGPGSTPG